MELSEGFAYQVVSRFPERDRAVDVLLSWARHDPAVARSFGINFLDLEPPGSEQVKARLLLFIDAALAARPEPGPVQTEEYVRAREEFVKNFRL